MQTHGQSNTPLYHRWEGMKRRCYTRSCPEYPHYGGRGIRVCSAWLHSFDVFAQWAMTNGFAPHLTIERNNVDGDYEPSNCSWETRRVQQSNQRKRSGTKYKYIGVNQLPSGKWRAMLAIRPKQIQIGIFNTEEEAKDARNKYILDNNLPHKPNP